MPKVFLTKEENEKIGNILEKLSAREPTHDGDDSRQAWIAHIAISDILEGKPKEVMNNGRKTSKTESH